jgi:hypothetical protein
VTSQSTTRSLGLTATCRLRPGSRRSSSGAPATAQFPIRFADIVFAEVLDPSGKNPKTRRVVVLTTDIELAAGYPMVVAWVTGTLPSPLTADYVKLPYKNPPGRHPKTGLTKESAVFCTWVVSINPNDVKGRSGFVPPAHMAIVNAKTAAQAKSIGGWP